MVGQWLVGTVTDARKQTPTGRSIVVSLPGWPGNIAGQHVDVRLTAPDGYQAVRSYSIASAGSGEMVELAVDKLPTGEVSPYLVDDLLPGDMLELRGPLGGWFVWKPSDTAPVQLIGGGSGVVPLVSMVRSHRDSGSSAPFKLLYSVRSPEDAFYREELAASEGPELQTAYVYTRRVPEGWPVAAGRVSKDVLAASVFPVSDAPAIFVCGPTGFVEAVATWLVELGYPAETIKTERFGG